MTIEQIKSSIKEYGLSQATISKALQINKSDLSNYLSGKKSLPISRAVLFELYFENLKNKLKIIA